jgi:hypothetical protein
MPQGRDRTSVGCENNGDGPVAKGAARDQLRMEMPMLQQWSGKPGGRFPVSTISLISR